MERRTDCLTFVDGPGLGLGMDPGAVQALVADDWETRRRRRLALSERDRRALQTHIAVRPLPRVVDDVVAWIAAIGTPHAVAAPPLPVAERRRWCDLIALLPRVGRGDPPSPSLVARCARGWLRYGLFAEAAYPRRVRGLSEEHAELIGDRASETAEQLAQVANVPLHYGRAA